MSKNGLIPLFNFKKNKIVDYPLDKTMKVLYYLEARPPEQTETKIPIKEIKIKISKSDIFVPLYDIMTNNLYIINRKNVYDRVVYNDYRFPDKMILDLIEENKKKYKASLEKTKNKVKERYLRKTKLITDFLSYYDYETLYSTYLKVFYNYSSTIRDASFTCHRRSFISYLSHIKPYYGVNELIKYAMNMEKKNIKTNFADMDNKELVDLCKFINQNDMTSDVLLNHHKYIIENNGVGLIQFYTVQGSYFINKYLRGLTTYPYQNDYLESIIEPVWNLVLNAPSFDNNYILYRFLEKDDHLRHLLIGDRYQEKGFMSTTRDPFYRNDLYTFGFILMKIRIPKDITGVALALETISHFPEEEEIIFPPNSNFILKNLDTECVYHNLDDEFSSKIKKRYEFEWVGNNKIEFPKRELYDQTKLLDFLKLDNQRTGTLVEKIDVFMSRYLDPMYRFKCQIGDNEFYVIAERFNSLGPYANMYALKTGEGFSLYSFYDNYLLFMIELAEIDGYRHMRVNYFTKYSQLRKDDIMGDDNFLKFIASVSYYFDAPYVIIYADYLSCDKISLQRNKHQRAYGSHNDKNQETR